MSAIGDQANASGNENGSAFASENESGYDSSNHCFRNIRERKREGEKKKKKKPIN